VLGEAPHTPRILDLVAGLGLGVHRNPAALEGSFGRQDGSAGAGAATATAAVTPPAGAAVDVRWAGLWWGVSMVTAAAAICGGEGEEGGSRGRGKGLAGGSQRRPDWW
jgi:hypothetical protein